MKREDLIFQMKDCIGKQDPIVFFEKMLGLFESLFQQMDSIQKDVKAVRMQSALAIHWEPKVASSMLSHQIDILRQDKDTYFEEISQLKMAFVEDRITQSYDEFCKFWQDILGWHPFLEYK